MDRFISGFIDMRPEAGTTKNKCSEEALVLLELYVTTDGRADGRTDRRTDGRKNSCVEVALRF